MGRNIFKEANLPDCFGQVVDKSICSEQKGIPCRVANLCTHKFCIDVFWKEEAEREKSKYSLNNIPFTDNDEERKRVFLILQSLPKNFNYQDIQVALWREKSILPIFLDLLSTGHLLLISSKD
mgnify:CR=1 FL=1